MSYFTETLNNTMSMLEFKGSPDARDTLDKLSGYHASKNDRKDLRQSALKPGSEDVRNMRDKKQYDNIAKSYGDTSSQHRDEVVARAAAIYRDSQAGRYGSYGKRAVAESSDPVYSDLVAIGAID